jgi:hypothetical protein
MNKLDSLGSLQRELQQCLGIEQDVPTFSRLAPLIAVVASGVSNGEKPRMGYDLLLYIL